MNDFDRLNMPRIIRKLRASEEAVDWLLSYYTGDDANLKNCIKCHDNIGQIIWVLHKLQKNDASCRYVAMLNERLLVERNPYWSLEFVNNFKGVDLKEHEKIVLESGVKQPWYCFNFSKIKGADIKALEKVVIESKNPDVCFSFLKNIPGADEDALSAVIRSGAPGLDTAESYKKYVLDKVKELQ